MNFSTTLGRLGGALLCSVLFAAGAQAGEGRQRLDAFMDGLVTLQAGFEQTLTDETGEVLETVTGTVYLNRPGRFRWDYEDPYHQSIIADGERIWIYDLDLAQVTVRPVDEALAATPAALLGDETDIEQTFQVSEMGEAEGLVWVRLIPRGAEDDGQYRGLDLGFENDSLRVMKVADNFGQVTWIRFGDERRNSALPAQLFQFTPPPGVDVLDATEGG